MLDIDIKGNAGNRRNFLTGSYDCRIKGPLFSLVTKMKDSSFMGSRQNDNEGSVYISPIEILSPYFPA